MFNRELRHPNVIKSLGVIFEDTTCTFIFPLYHCNLRMYMKSNPNLSKGDKFGIVKQIAQGLSYIHSRGKIHRDIKQENILVHKSSITCNSFVVADIGIMSYSNKGKTMVGTRHYIAPEVDGKSTYDQRADIYSFGLLMWELFSDADLYTQTKQQPCKDMLVHCTDAMKNLICKCIEINAAHRPQNMNKVLEMLSGCFSVSDKVSTKTNQVLQYMEQ